MIAALGQYFATGFAMGTLMWAASFVYQAVRGAMHTGVTE